MLALGALSCAPAPSAPPTDAPAQPPGQVVARVGDEVIDAEAVRAYVADHGGTARAALRALEEDALLRQAARRSGWRANTTAAQAVQDEQLLAQRVLLDLEASHPLVGPSEAEVAAFLDAHQGDIIREEQRDCVQVLVELPEGATAEQDEAGRAYAAQTLARMATEGVSEVWSTQPPDHQGLRVLSQYLPPATPSTPIPEPLRSVVFARDEPGPAAAPVRTAAGWHAIALAELHPAVPAGSPRARQVARQRLVTQQRAAALDELLRALAQRFTVDVSARNTQAVLPHLGSASGSGT